MASAVFCIAPSESVAVSIVSQLKSAGFTDNDISVLFPDKTGTRDFAHEQHTKAPEGAATGGVAGGIIGGALGALAGIGALAIPGVGPFIAAGPIMGLLSGAGVGGGVGLIVGTLIGMGVPELEAKRYEGKVRGGGILISCHCDGRDEVKNAKDIYEGSGATDIVTGGEKSPPKVDRTDRPRGAGEPYLAPSQRTSATPRIDNPREP
jgi:hypothetical protein